MLAAQTRFKLCASVGLHLRRRSLRLAKYSRMQAMLTPEQIEQYERDGFLTVPDFTPPDEVQALQRRGIELVESHEPVVTATFSTKAQAAKNTANNTTDAYFLDSANNISFFYEDGAFGPDGALVRGKLDSVNKMGHAMHDLDHTFRSWARSDRVAGVLRALGYRRPLIVQSMFHFKSPGIGSEVALHQDSTFLATDPPSVVGLWLALEDADKGNGCMWALPGVHKQGVRKRFVHRDGKMSFEGELPEVGREQFVPLEVPAGTLILLHGANMHYSDENRSPHSRNAFIIHVVEGADGYTWSPENWLQRRPDFPFEPLYDDTAAASNGAAAPPIAAA